MEFRDFRGVMLKGGNGDFPSEFRVFLGENVKKRKIGIFRETESLQEF